AEHGSVAKFDKHAAAGRASGSERRSRARVFLRIETVKRASDFLRVATHLWVDMARAVGGKSLNS
ncbi:MAG: hypothetical protein WKH64_19195, partial [Chloroflexia bacterium]